MIYLLEWIFCCCLILQCGEEKTSLNQANHPEENSRRPGSASSDRCTQTPKSVLRNDGTSSASKKPTKRTTFEDGGESPVSRRSLIPQPSRSRSASGSPGRSPSSTPGSRIPRLIPNNRSQSSSPARGPRKKYHKSSFSTRSGQSSGRRRSLPDPGFPQQSVSEPEHNLSSEEQLASVEQNQSVSDPSLGLENLSRYQPDSVSGFNRPGRKRSGSGRKLPQPGKGSLYTASDDESGYAGSRPICNQILKQDNSSQTERITTLRQSGTQTDASLIGSNINNGYLTFADEGYLHHPLTGYLGHLPADTSVCSEVSTDSSPNNVVQAILEADRAMQERMAATAPPHVTEHWYRNFPEDTESVHVYMDNGESIVPLTDSAKQALKKMPQNQNSPRNMTHTWPITDHNLHRVNVIIADDCPTDDVFLSPRGHDYDSNDNLDRSDETLQHHMEVVEHRIDRTTHVLEPHTSLLSDQEDTDTEDGVQTSEDERDNMSWNSGVTEPEPDSYFIDTREDGTQTLRTRKTQTPDDAYTQTPGRPRKLPVIPQVGAGNTGSQVDDDDQSTNPDLMNTVIYPTTMGTFRTRHEGTSPERDLIGSLSLHATRDVPQQPTYLRDYQKYIESIDGTTSGLFLGDYENHPDIQQQPNIRSSHLQEDNVSMPIMTRLDHIAPRDSAIGAAAADSDMESHEHFITSESPILTPTRGQQTHRSTHRDKLFGSLPNSLPTSRPSSATDRRYIPGRATPIAQQILSRTYPWTTTREPNPPCAWQNDSDKLSDIVTKQDFSQQTPSTVSTQTPIRVCLRGNNLFVLDGERDRNSPFQGMECWPQIGEDDVVIQAARDFGTQTFGQFDNWRVTNATQTRNSLHNLTQNLDFCDSSTQTLEDSATQTSPIPELMHLYGEPSRDIPASQSIHKFGPQPPRFDTHSALQNFQPSFQHPRVSVAPRQPTVSEAPSREEEEQSASHMEEERQSLKDKHKSSKKKDKKKKKEAKSRERSHDRETVDDGASAMTYGSNMSRKDILKLMLSQVRDLKKKIEPEVTAQKDTESKVKSKHKSKGKEKPKVKPKQGREDDSAIESLPEDEPDSDKLYTRRRLEMLYGKANNMSTVAPSSDQRHYRMERRHSVESLHSDKGDRDDSPDQTYDRLRHKYIPQGRHSSRRSYTPSPPRRPHYSPDYSRRSPPHMMDTYRRYPVRDVPLSRRQLPQVPAHMRQTGRSPYMHGPVPYTPTPHSMTPAYTPQPYSTLPQGYYSAPNPATPVQSGFNAFRPISAQPGPMATPIHGTPMFVVNDQSQAVQPSPHPPYIVLASPSQAPRADGGQDKSRGGHRQRPASAQAAIRGGSSLDNSLSRVTKAAREMKSLTHRLSHK